MAMIANRACGIMRLIEEVKGASGYAGKRPPWSGVYAASKLALRAILYRTAIGKRDCGCAIAQFNVLYLKSV
jgi:hypothetical protein